MASYILKKPVAAVQYKHRQNEDEIVALARSAGYEGFSSTNASAPGFLKVFNGGLNLQIEDGSWVVAMGGSVATLTTEQFFDLFAPASVSGQ